MKKFKVKNRQKRKYVKKNELIADYASALSVTFGIVPLIMMGIALFATVIMTNPPSFEVYIPTVDFTLPALPEIPTISTPEMPRVTLPEVTIPNPVPYIAAGMQATIEAIETFATTITTATLGMLDALVTGSITLFEQISAAILASFTMFGEFVVSSVSFILTAYVNGIINIAKMLLYALSVTVAFVDYIIDTTLVWGKAMIVATINALNAFVWFLGTPFRALYAYGEAVSIQLTPYVQFLSVSFEKTLGELSQGGESLVNGTVYVTETVEHNQQGN